MGSAVQGLVLGVDADVHGWIYQNQQQIDDEYPKGHCPDDDQPPTSLLIPAHSPGFWFWNSSLGVIGRFYGLPPSSQAIIAAVGISHLSDSLLPMSELAG